MSGLIGLAVRRSKSVETVIGASLLGSVSFFLATNWAVWQFTSMYAHTPAGLFNCYLMALPFFRGTLMGDLFYTAVLFGSFESVTAWFRSSPRSVVADGFAPKS